MIYTKYNKTISKIITLLQVFNVRLPFFLFGNDHIRTSFFAGIFCIINIKIFYIYLRNLDNSDKLFILLHSYIGLISLLNIRKITDIYYIFGIYFAYFMYIGFQFLNKKYNAVLNLDFILYALILHPIYLILTKLLDMDPIAYIYGNNKLTENYGIFLIGEYSPLAVCLTYFSGFLISIFQFKNKNNNKYLYLSILFLVLSIMTNEKIIFLFIIVSIINMNYKIIKLIYYRIINYKTLWLIISFILIYLILNLNFGAENIRTLNNPASYLINIDRTSLWSKILEEAFKINLYNPLLGVISYQNTIGFITNDYHNYFLRIFMQGGILAIIIFIYWIFEMRKISMNSRYYYIYSTFFTCLLLACFVQDALKGLNALYLLALHKSILISEDFDEK